LLSVDSSQAASVGADVPEWLRWGHEGSGPERSPHISEKPVARPEGAAYIPRSVSPGTAEFHCSDWLSAQSESVKRT
jgi:hypothetical protein